MCNRSKFLKNWINLSKQSRIKIAIKINKQVQKASKLTLIVIFFLFSSFNFYIYILLAGI